MFHGKHGYFVDPEGWAHGQWGWTPLEIHKAVGSLGRGLVAQSVTCLVANTCLNADPGMVCSIPARSHTFMEIDREKVLWSFFSLPLIQEGLLSV